MKRLFYDGESMLFVQPPCRRTIRFEGRRYFIALPKLYFLATQHYLYPLIGDGIFRKPRGGDIVYAEFAIWEFYNVFPTGSVCLGYAIVQPEEMLDYFWSTSFNEPGFKFRPIFVNDRFLPIANLDRWEKLTKSDPELQHKLDIAHYIATSKTIFKIAIDSFEHRGRYYALDISHSLHVKYPSHPKSLEQMRISLSKLFG